MSIKVLAAGILTTVQDLGRTGYQQFGMPCCGVMDQNAFRIANLLAGNPPEAAVLEHTIFGGSYRFDEDAVIVLTGADMAPSLNQNLCPMYRPVLVPSGSILSLGIAASGCRTYLAIAGGIEVPSVLGSRSTNLKCQIGGYQGRALQSGDILRSGKTAKTYDELNRKYKELVSHKKTAFPDHPSYPSEVTVRVIEGPQNDYFTEHGLHTFFSQPYTVSPQSDRMGCRMDGPAIESVHGTDIISDGIVFGSIQVTPAGQPIILMADRQTTGGYAKIATVCSFDLPVLAQCRPGDTVHFEKIDIEAAQQLLSQ